LHLETTKNWVAEYVDELRRAALLALDEEAILVVVLSIHHAE